MEKSDAIVSADLIRSEFDRLGVEVEIETKKKTLSSQWVVRVVRREAIPMHEFISRSMYQDYLTRVPAILSSDVKHTLKESSSGAPTLSAELNISIHFTPDQIKKLVTNFEERIDSAVARLAMSATF